MPGKVTVAVILQDSAGKTIATAKKDIIIESKNP